MITVVLSDISTDVRKKHQKFTEKYAFKYVLITTVVLSDISTDGRVNL